MQPIDFVILSHNRLQHLVRTVEGLRERTPEPIRLTIVDNASGPDVRNWLAKHRAWFERLILRPTNEYVSALQHGIDATASDPYVVTDPDLVVPGLTPSWLARQLDLMERHPDFGLIAVDFDEASIPFSAPEDRAALGALRGPIHRVADDLIEGNVGTAFQLIRRDALREPYVQDHKTCDSVRRAGYRVGWNPTIKVHHLGSRDIELYPEYLARKAQNPHYPDYPIALRQVRRAPTLGELARAAPLIAETRASEVPDASVLELAWGAPALGGAIDGPLTLLGPRVDRIPVEPNAAGAVVLLDPPPERAPALLDEAVRVAAQVVVAVVPLEAFGGRLAADLAPPGWRGTEHAGVGDLVLALADEADASSFLGDRVGLQTLEHRERWLSLFAAGDFGSAERRLFVFKSDDAAPIPASVRHDPTLVAPWQPADRAIQRPARDVMPERPGRAGVALGAGRALARRSRTAVSRRARRLVASRRRDRRS